MPKAAPKIPEFNINLLPKETVDVESNSLLHWLLTAGRYLIIFTEIVAVSIFLVSVFLAKQKNDLRIEIRNIGAKIDFLQKCNPSDATEFCEERFRRVQDQINHVAAIRSTQLQHNQVIDEFLKLLPANISLNSLVVDGNEITFSGSFSTEQQLQTLVETFNSSDKITGLDILNLTKEAIFEFTANAEINETAFIGGAR